MSAAEGDADSCTGSRPPALGRSQDRRVYAHAGDPTIGRMGLLRVRHHRPLMVTGMPRSGTTWLARLFASAPNTALPGREPMNPRGRQFALGGTLTGWARVTQLTPRQRRALWACYMGWHPLAYSRYGHHQLHALLPGRRCVVKDPFALLSIPAVADATNAEVTVLFRHPAAMLASYRRMGWTTDYDEVQPIIETFNRGNHARITSLPAPGEVSPAAEMAHFWRALYEITMADIDSRPDLRVRFVSHAEIAGGGESAARRLFDDVRLPVGSEVAAMMGDPDRGATEPPSAADTGELHRFGRSPSSVAESWRKRIPAHEVLEIEEVAQATWDQLNERRLILH